MSPLVHLVVLAVIVLCTPACSANRVLSATIDPGCDIHICNSNVNVVYVKGVGHDDIMHYLWSTSGSVSVLLARTALNVNLSIDWPNFLSENSSYSVTFTEEPLEVAAVIFTKLYIYDDRDDKVNIAEIPSDLITKISTIDMNEDPVTLTTNTSDHVTAAFIMTPNQTLQLNLDAFNDEGHANRLPGLDHTLQSFQMEIVLDQYPTEYNNTRFAVEFVVLSYNETNDVSFDLAKHRSIDDEYTPGVFLTYSIEDGNDNVNSSFMQWKPVCYTNKDRTTEYSTNTIQDFNPDLITSDSDEIINSLAYAYFGPNVSHLAIGSLNVSFGLEGDGFYEETNYLTWTMVIGIGTSPSEKFSTLVIIVIIVGFGVPALLILIGGTFIIIRRCRRNDDDLNLSNTKLFDEEEE